ncbi:MAG: hypothetical protein M0033_07815 [Nitrospiraceae bacterium]|nr:hypothetical protein [Nitrospiraceae bacterium]MDA8326110.1 hypothetical protein [Nitrospiraceae bacterium]
MSKRVKPGFRIMICLVSCLIAGFGITPTGRGIQKSIQPAFAEETQGAQFAWQSNRPGTTRAQIALGRATRLRFEFTVKNAEGTRVQFVIASKFAEMGIKINPDEATITNGMAQSEAQISCPPGAPLGRFDMPIVMVDARTKKEMGRGIIQFMLLPAGVGGC